MPRTLFNIAPLLPALEQGACVLTPNSRLRNKLLAAFHAEQSPSQHCWRAPQVFSFDEWVKEQQHIVLDSALSPVNSASATELPAPTTLSSTRAIISPFAAQQLWQSIIQVSPEGAELINPVKLASDAHSAYQTLQKWNLSWQQLDALCDEHGWEYQSPFPAWAEAFDQQLQERQLQTTEDAQIQLRELFAQQQLPTYEQLILLGFDDCTPLQRSLFEQAAKVCKFLPANDPKQSPNALQVASYPSLEEEIQAAAQWCERILQQNPDATIGVIAPNLGQIRHSVEHIFTTVLEPHFPLPETSRYTLPFNFSAGVPLGSTALINDAMELLQLNHASLPSERLESLLNSPFWQAGEDIILSAALQAKLQRQARDTTRTSQLRQWCHQHWLDYQGTDQEDVDHCNQNSTLDPASNPEAIGDVQQWQQLDQALQDFESLRRQFGHQHLPAKWLQLFQQQLHILGWPGQRRLDSNEYQQMTQWLQLLDNYCQLDALNQPISCHKALELLKQLVEQTHFQAQTPESPIQILGILEGAGLNFSHLWMLGMNQNQWPPAASPNSLLPLGLQRHLHMPHADAERELHYAQAILSNYQHGSEQWVASYARFDDDRPQEVSPLLTQIQPAADTSNSITPPIPEASNGNTWQAYQQQLANTQTLQWVNIGSAPPVSDDEKALLSGGSAILRNQALLPQAAFLDHRLGAQKPIKPQQGFNPIERGNILHDALSVLWKQWNDQKTLASLTPEQRQQQIKHALEQQIKRVQQREPHVFGEHYCELEVERQSKLIQRWLEQELERPIFTVVKNEEALDADFAGLTLRLRLDRMDKLENGQLIVIDYKTGTPTIRQWAGERPEEPQLPLYALCYQQDVDALMFAQINSKDITIKGLGQLDTPHNGIENPANSKIELPDEWPQVKEHWQQHLSLLVHEFLAGEASLEISSHSAKRYYEHLLPLLRWQEQEEISDFYGQGHAYKQVGAHKHGGLA